MTDTHFARIEPKQVSIDPARLQEMVDTGLSRDDAVRAILAEQDPQPTGIADDLPPMPDPPDTWPEDAQTSAPIQPGPAALAAPGKSAIQMTFAAHVLRALLDGKSVNGHLERLPDEYRDLAENIQATPPNKDQRTAALKAGLAELDPATAAAALAAVFAADPLADLDTLAKDPEPEPDPGSFDMPALPEAARIDPAIGAGVAPWLDAYVKFSRQWSPRAFDGFHVACALWLLSTIAARRVKVHMGKERFTNLYIALTARTSLYAKSTTAEIAIQILRALGLGWLLAADNATPQKFIADLTVRLISGYSDLTDEQKEYARLRVGLAGQRGWFYDEFGQHVAAMMRDGGFMADFRGLMRRFDDTPERYESGTIGRGSDIIERPYLALMANLTPDDLRPFARRGSALWGDGFLARFALITPPEGERRRDRFPQGERVIPGELLTPLRHWHERLGLPKVEVIDVTDEEGKHTGEKRVEITPRPPETLGLAPEAYEAFYAYDLALGDILAESSNHDLDGNYARMAEKALRIAALLASLDNAGRVTLPYWARAQAITEDWRAGLHRLYSQINEPPPSQDEEHEEKLLQVITKHGPSTAAEAARFVRGLSSGAAAHLLDGMVNAGELQSSKTQKGTKRYELPKEP